MTEKIKVLQSLGTLGIGGNEIFVMNFFRHIDKSRFQMDFVIYDDTRMDFYNEIVSAGSKVYICKREKKNKIIQSISQIRQLRKILRENHYDVIHCHSCSFIGILKGAIPGFLAKGTRVVSHAHNVGMPTNTFADKIFRQFMKVVVSQVSDIGCACSDIAGKSKYTEQFIRSGRYLILNNAIETGQYKYNVKKREEIRERLGIGKYYFVIGNVGRFEYQKNHKFLLDVFKAVLAKKAEAILLLIGDGSNRRSLERKAEELGIKSNVIFLGPCTCAADYYQAMDCFVLPSHYEGFPFVLVEAQVNGLRCIVSENMTRAVNISGGVIFKSLKESADKWAEDIVEFGSQRMDKKEVEKVIEKYELRNEVLKFERLYTACAAGEISVGDMK